MWVVTQSSSGLTFPLNYVMFFFFFFFFFFPQLIRCMTIAEIFALRIV